jgi:hypothetical protein
MDTSPVANFEMNRELLDIICIDGSPAISFWADL